MQTQYTMQDTLVFHYSHIGVTESQPALQAVFDPNKTVGDLIRSVSSTGLGYGKRIEMSMYDADRVGVKWSSNGPYWSHDTKLSECAKVSGCDNGSYSYLMMIYVTI